MRSWRRYHSKEPYAEGEKMIYLTCFEFPSEDKEADFFMGQRNDVGLSV